MLAGYWVIQYFDFIFGMMRNASPSGPGFSGMPSPMPWLPAGLVLVLIGSTMWITGLVMALAAKRRRAG